MKVVKKFEYTSQTEALLTMYRIAKAEADAIEQSIKETNPIYVTEIDLLKKWLETKRYEQRIHAAVARAAIKRDQELGFYRKYDPCFKPGHPLL